MTVRLSVPPFLLSSWAKLRAPLEPLPKSLVWAQVGSLVALTIVLGLSGTSFFVSIMVLAIHVSICGLLVAGWNRVFDALVQRVRAVRLNGASPKGMEAFWGPLGVEVERLLETFERAQKSIEESRFSTVKAMALAMEARDVYTQGHCVRVRTLTRRILDRIQIDAGRREAVELASLVHDIGKIGIPDAILLKPGELTPEETKRARLHAEIGHEILRNFEEMKEVAVFVRHHHERFDGGGYPDGLEGEQIPFGSRVIAVTDAIDAMRSERPYRPAFSFEEIVQELKHVRGTQLDPELVDAAVAMLQSHLSSERVAKEVLEERLSTTDVAEPEPELAG